MSRYFALFALLAFAAAYPASDDVPRPISTITESELEDSSPWFRFPPFGNIFAPLTKLFSSFADIGPRIEVDDDKFRVIINVKDYKKDDLEVKVKGDFILVQGTHEAKHDKHELFASQFFHTYTLPINASASDVTATLTSDGYLDVTAPINGADENEKAGERVVPIVESGKPLKEEKEQIAPASVPVTEKIENFDKVEPLDTPVEPVANVEPLDTPVEPVANVESLDTPVEPLANVESVDKIEKVEPTATAEKIESVDKVEPVPVTSEAPEVEADKKEVTTPASDREEVTVPVNEIKSPQDNEVNEIQP